MLELVSQLLGCIGWQTMDAIPADNETEFLVLRTSGCIHSTTRDSLMIEAAELELPITAMGEGWLPMSFLPPYTHGTENNVQQ